MLSVLHLVRTYWAIFQCAILHPHQQCICSSCSMFTDTWYFQSFFIWAVLCKWCLLVVFFFLKTPHAPPPTAPHPPTKPLSWGLTFNRSQWAVRLHRNPDPEAGCLHMLQHQVPRNVPWVTCEEEDLSLNYIQALGSGHRPECVVGLTGKGEESLATCLNQGLRDWPREVQPGLPCDSALVCFLFTGAVVIP